MSKKKIKEWCDRYLVAEIISVTVGLVFALVLKATMMNTIIIAFIVTWIQNIGFYGYIVWKDLRAMHKTKKEFKGKGIGIKEFLVQFRNMIIEFGPAEYLDSTIIRPFYLAVLPLAITNYGVAIFIGTILADISYYIPTIISYESRKKLFKE